MAGYKRNDKNGAVSREALLTAVALQDHLSRRLRMPGVSAVPGPSVSPENRPTLPPTSRLRHGLLQPQPGPSSSSSAAASAVATHPAISQGEADSLSPFIGSPSTTLGPKTALLSRGAAAAGGPPPPPPPASGKTRLTLAQYLGLFPLPPPSLSEAEWREVQERSRERQDSAAVCPICQEEFKGEQQVLLSCSHTFHRQCLRSFERHAAGLACCPLCRATQYQRRLIDDGRKTFEDKCATRIQAHVRGFLARRRFRQLRRAIVPRDERLRRRWAAERLEEGSQQILDDMEAERGDLDAFFEELDAAVAVNRRVCDALEKPLEAARRRSEAARGTRLPARGCDEEGGDGEIEGRRYDVSSPSSYDASRREREGKDGSEGAAEEDEEPRDRAGVGLQLLDLDLVAPALLPSSLIITGGGLSKSKSVRFADFEESGRQSPGPAASQTRPGDRRTSSSIDSPCSRPSPSGGHSRLPAVHSSSSSASASSKTKHMSAPLRGGRRGTVSGGPRDVLGGTEQSVGSSESDSCSGSGSASLRNLPVAEGSSDVSSPGEAISVNRHEIFHMYDFIIASSQRQVEEKIQEEIQRQKRVREIENLAAAAERRLSLPDNDRTDRRGDVFGSGFGSVLNVLFSNNHDNQYLVTTNGNNASGLNNGNINDGLRSGYAAGSQPPPPPPPRAGRRFLESPGTSSSAAASRGPGSWSGVAGADTSTPFGNRQAVIGRTVTSRRRQAGLPAGDRSRDVASRLATEVLGGLPLRDSRTDLLLVPSSSRTPRSFPSSASSPLPQSLPPRSSVGSGAGAPFVGDTAALPPPAGPSAAAAAAVVVDWEAAALKAHERGETDCMICLSGLDDKEVALLDCSHCLHLACLLSFEVFQIAAGRPPTCPCCRHRYLRRSLPAVGKLTVAFGDVAFAARNIGDGEGARPKLPAPDADAAAS